MANTTRAEARQVASGLAPLARLFLSLIFIVSGISKLTAWEQTSAYMNSKGMTYIPLFLTFSFLIEFFGGWALLIGSRTRLTAALLFLYLIPVTVVFHNFWALEGAEFQTQLINFLKNLAIMGGLLTVVMTGAGRVSMDAWRARKKRKLQEESRASEVTTEEQRRPA